MNYLWLTLGLALLFGGAQILVRGASELAGWAWVSSVVIGLTVVAYGTSSPELVVSVSSAWEGHFGMTMGNVLGSNIFNILFILGLCATAIPLVVHQKLLQWDVPLLIALTVGIYLFCFNRVLSIWEGAILLMILGGYTVWAVVESREESRQVREEYEREFGSGRHFGALRLALSLAGVAVGLGLLIYGSRLFTDSAQTIARGWGISELVIGLTIVGAGTSMPEVITSLLAAWRGETDIAVGNVIGSNLFNLTGVLGLSAVVSGSGIPLTPTMIQIDLPVLLIVTVLCLPIFLSEHHISRTEGALFLVLFVTYISYRVWA